MRPKGTSEALAVCRQRGLAWLRHGKSLAMIAEALGVTERSVRRWRQTAQVPMRQRRIRAPGRPRRLSQRQVDRLKRQLARGAFAQGYAEDYWTLGRIAHVIWHLFGVRYHPSSVWHVLKRMGWSSQKPQRRPLQRDELAVARWKRYRWPQIKKMVPTSRHLGL
jgi:transposase